MSIPVLPESKPGFFSDIKIKFEGLIVFALSLQQFSSVCDIFKIEKCLNVC
jgi:hypothetical protein